MLKHIPVEELKPGMFIIDVTLSWSKKLGLERTQYIEDEGIIETFKQKGVKFIYIDPEKTRVIQKKAEPETEVKKVAVEVELEEEIKKALVIREEAKKVISSIMTDIRSGKKITVDEINSVVEKVVESVLGNHQTLVGLVRMQQKDQYIFKHAISSCALMVAFAASLGYDGGMQQELGVGALLHDIGMMNIPSTILNKPSKLNANEVEELRKHVQYGYEILDGTPGVPDTTLQMVLQHHERYNGSGYPNGLRKNEINKFGQMIALIDVYDAATFDKGYKKGITPSAALAEILAKSNVEFETELVHSFIQCLGIYPFGSLVQLRNGLVGLVIDSNVSDLLYPKIRIIYDLVKRGMVVPYDVKLSAFKDDSTYKIEKVDKKEKYFFTTNDINKILGAN